ncbi:MAG: class I SAM-dependent methyltransferase, partial [Ktedonobacteraceae bacterium]
MTFFHRSKRRQGQLSAQETPPDLPHNVVQETRRYLPHSPYLLPKDQEEALRLDFQHHALLHAIGSLSVAPIPLDTGMILDVGCGTGIWAVEMARLFPTAQVIGVDVDPALFKAEAPQNCTLRTGDVLSR